MSNEIKIALNQLSNSIALPITSVLQVFIWTFYFFFFHPNSPFFTLHIFYQLLIFYTPDFPQFVVHSLITWLSHDDDGFPVFRNQYISSPLCLLAIFFFSGKTFWNVLYGVTMNLPMLMVAVLFICTSKISGNFNCFQVINKHHFVQFLEQTLKLFHFSNYKN